MFYRKKAEEPGQDTGRKTQDMRRERNIWWVDHHYQNDYDKIERLTQIYYILIFCAHREHWKNCCCFFSSMESRSRIIFSLLLMLFPMMMMMMMKNDHHLLLLLLSPISPRSFTVLLLVSFALINTRETATI